MFWREIHLYRPWQAPWNRGIRFHRRPRPEKQWPGSRRAGPGRRMRADHQERPWPSPGWFIALTKWSDNAIIRYQSKGFNWPVFYIVIEWSRRIWDSLAVRFTGRKLSWKRFLQQYCAWLWFLLHLQDAAAQRRDAAVRENNHTLGAHLPKSVCKVFFCQLMYESHS